MIIATIVCDSALWNTSLARAKIRSGTKPSCSLRDSLSWEGEERERQMKGNKKTGSNARSKVVVRHLPPSLSRSDFFGLIDPLFADRYGWASFRPGKISSWRGQWCSRAYIHFKTPEDVLDFAGFFDGHVFVNEKGVRFKAIVEYAPSQQVPKPCPKDGREGTIYMDPDYLEFIKVIAKPVENPRKPVVQLEAIGVEQAQSVGISEKIPVVTPLMEFVRQKRAGNGVQDVSAVRKTSRRARKISKGRRASVTVKHGQAKKQNAPEDNKKDTSRREKPENGNLKLEGKTILLHKGRELEVSEAKLSSSANPTVLIASKQSHLHKSREKLIRTILLNNEARQSSSGIPQKKINPKIIDSRKQLCQDTDLGSSVTCNVPEDVKKATDDQSVRRELRATDNILEKSVKHEQVIGVRSRHRTGENSTPSTGQNVSSRVNGHNTKNEYYRRKDNDFINKQYARSSKQAACEKRVWVQKSSSDPAK